MNILLHYKLKTSLLLAALILLSFGANAQQTGSFNKTITFKGEQRILSFFVPADYDSTRPYKLMVSLHGMGDNSTNMRNALSSGTSFITYIPNTILVCPDGGNDQFRSFNLPAGDEEIIQVSIDETKADYNIDTNNIILEGFSLGGRSALQYGLAHPDKFKGLLLHTPAIQGVKDALTGTSLGKFNYANASKIPVYITHGADDVNYTAPIDTAYEQLILNNGIVRLYRFAGMGHTVPSFQRTQNFLPFLDQPSFNDDDLDIVKLTTPSRTCNSQVSGTVLVRNLGKNNISTIEFEYKLNNGNPAVYTWNGTLAPFNHALIQLPAVASTVGNNTLEVNVKTLNGSVQDTVITNNRKTYAYSYVSQGVSLPVNEGFDGQNFPPDGWLLQRSGDVFLPWIRETGLKKDSLASMVTFNSIFIFDNAGRREEILSPVLDLTTVNDPSVRFDVAFNYVKYTPPYFADTTVFADTLQVFISTDCGRTFTSLYKKGGKDLATFDTAITNPLSLTSIDFDARPENWRTEQISLANFKNSKEAIIKFSYISGMGGLVAVDNVSFSTFSGIEENKPATFKLFPNPAADKVNLVSGNESIQKVNIIDISGRNVFTIVNKSGFNKEISVNTSSLKDGFYFFEVFTSKGISTRKVLIKR